MVSSDQGELRRLSHRFARLARVSSELLVAETLEDVTQVVIEHLADEAQANVASLSLLADEHTLRLVGLRGAGRGIAQRWATYPVTAATPAGEAVRTGRRVLLRSRAETEERFPGLEAAAPGERAILCMPLRSGQRTLGAISLSFAGSDTPDSGLLEFLGVIADTCAQAVDRVQARAEAADGSARLRFLAEASAELASSLDYEVTLARVARMAVPWFADRCAISLEDDGLLRTLAVAHVDPDKVALARELQRRFPADPRGDQGSYRVLRTGASELTPEISDEMLQSLITEPELLEMVRQLDFRSAMVVPLRTESRTLGVVTWVAGQHGRRFDAADLALGEDLARRAAVAIDNAQLHTEQRELVGQLQRAVLPAHVASPAGWTVAAEYHASGRTEAGGDFYDVVALDEDRVAVFVGDVMGRGVEATATMAQMRSALRTLMALDPDPAGLMERLDSVLATLAVDQLVTVAYAVADRREGTLTVVSAGHPAPVLVPAGGPVQLVPVEGLLLGAGAVQPGPRVPVRLPFAPGDVVVLYTDGLVERRDEDVDAGQVRLCRAVEALRGGDLRTALSRVIVDVRAPSGSDDLAAVALRLDPEPSLT